MKTEININKQKSFYCIPGYKDCTRAQWQDTLAWNPIWLQSQRDTWYCCQPTPLTIYYAEFVTRIGSDGGFPSRMRIISSKQHLKESFLKRHGQGNNSTTQESLFLRVCNRGCEDYILNALGTWMCFRVGGSNKTTRPFITHKIILPLCLPFNLKVGLSWYQLHPTLPLVLLQSAGVICLLPGDNN